MADFAFDRFAGTFAARLRELGYSLTQAEAKWPATDRAMLSRACTGKTLSAGNVLLLCQMAGLDPFEFVEPGKQRRLSLAIIREKLENQPVTAGVPRETSNRRSAA